MEILLWLVGYLAVCMLVGRVIAGVPPGEAARAPNAAPPRGTVVLVIEELTPADAPPRSGPSRSPLRRRRAARG